ncbi:nuclear transport factor 2 family protein [Roseomonas marmotae]|uniref:Nuclear transport factor 2 family protein n=1 Tax=Roseomonas marmotae TaxID=2768161 RepID=A0ABS3KDW3_9PROT|nr:nuclear transport factor 2 family protein [Roseomonas marmotae]QTI80761.1 nuclear transport factor 2 family protein [Roseomonas marmotae]
MITEAEVEEAEAALREATLTGDVVSLDGLLSEALIFTDQTGRVIGKSEDMEAHRTGLLRLTRVQVSEQEIRLAGNAAVVTLRAELAGTWDSNAFVGAFRYTRVWRREEAGLRVLAAHCSGAAVA